MNEYNIYFELNQYGVLNIIRYYWVILIVGIEFFGKGIIYCPRFAVIFLLLLVSTTILTYSVRRANRYLLLLSKDDTTYSWDT